LEFSEDLQGVAMPIYAYRCQDCGFAKDVLQKIADAPLSVCPSCGQAGFKKQLTAAGFQLKGTGWYATDFKGGNSPKPDADVTKPQESTPAATQAAPATATATVPADGGSKAA
jgi:putative FmdB family regulatory protein